MMELQEYLLHILDNYPAEKEKPFRDNPLASYIRTQAFESIPDTLFDRKDYAAMASPGKGVWAAVPWLGIFDRSISTTAQKGYDIVYLFREDSQGVYLSLNQGFTFFKEEFKQNNPKKKIEKVSKYWIAKLNLIREKEKFGFTTAPINLNSSAKTDMPEGYELGNIYSKYYSYKDLKTMDNTVLLKDLEHLKMVFTELRSLLTDGYAKSIQRIVSENHTEDLETEIFEKFTNDPQEQLSITKSLKHQRVVNYSNQQLDTTYISEKNADYIVSNQKLEQQLQRQKVIGSQAENLAFKYYFDRTNEIVKNHENAAEILDKLQYRGQDHGFGYDVQALDLSDLSNGIETEIHVEVKATVNRHGNVPFYMSRNEIQHAMMDRDTYRIFRIYDFNAETPKFDELRVFNDESQINEMKRLDQLMQSATNVVPMTYLITEWQSMN